MGSANLGTSFIGGDDKGHGQSLPSFLFKDSFEPPSIVAMTSGGGGGYLSGSSISDALSGPVADFTPPPKSPESSVQHV